MAEAQGRWSDAIRCWRRCQESGYRPKGMELKMAEALIHSGDRQGAIAALRSAVNQGGNPASVRLALSKLLIEEKKWSEAAEQARRAMEADSNNTEARLVYLRARMGLAARDGGDNNRIWEDIENELKSSSGSGISDAASRMLSAEAAIHRGRYQVAKGLIDLLKEDYPSNMKPRLLEIDLLFAQGKKKEATEQCRELAKSFPESLSLIKRLAALLVDGGNFSECESMLAEAMGRTKQQEAQRALCILLAQVYAQGGETGKAYELLTSTAEAMPDDIVVRRQLIKYCEMPDKNEQLQELIDEIKAIEGEQGWQWRYEQARVWFERDSFANRYPEIVGLLRENLSANPDDVNSRKLLAATYERAGELQLAISNYIEATELSSEDAGLISSTVSLLYKAGQYERADEILNRANMRGLDSPELSRLELQSYLRKGKLDSASSTLEDIFEKDPANTKVGLSLALLHMRQGKLDEAGRLLDELWASESESVAIAAAMVQLKMRQGLTEEAVKFCDDIVRGMETPITYMLRAQTKAAAGDTTSAREDLKKAEQLEPENIDTLLFKNKFLQSLGQTKEAIDVIEQAIMISPEDVRVQKRAVLMYLSSRDKANIAKGKDLLEKAIDANPNDLDLRIVKARQLWQIGDSVSIGEAIEILKEITTERPGVEAAWALLGEIYHRQGDEAKVMDTALLGLSYLPDSKVLLLTKARSEALRSGALAIGTFKLLHEKFPEDADCVIYLAGAYLKAGQYDNAISLLNKQLDSAKSTGDRERLNIELAGVLYAGGRISEAEERFGELYEELGGNPSVLSAHARALRNGGKWEQLIGQVTDWYKQYPGEVIAVSKIVEELGASKEVEALKAAERILRAVITVNSESPEFLNALAILLQMTGRSTEAAQLYEKVLTLEPTKVVAMNNLAWILCEEQGKYARALELAERGVAISPTYLDLIDTYGIIYYRLGQYEKAAEKFRECINLYSRKAPGLSGTYFHLGRALESLGRKSEAAENLRRALELNMEIGGLSSADIAEAKQLLDKLS